jgi:TIR domain/SIR2-like domain
VEFHDWDRLVYGIGRGECILFLGPQLPLAGSGGVTRIPTDDLATRLLGQLDGEPAARASADANSLARVAQRFLAQEAEVDLEMEINRWHQGLADQPSALHDHLAALPFRLILTSSLDPLMEGALRRAGKQPVIERYHYRGKNKALLPEATTQTPLLFHLYGWVSEPASVVITETQLLDFLAALISKDPPLPNDLNAALTNGKLFLFLGFGLHQWYLRILLHVLKVLRRGSRSFAVELGDGAFDASAADAILFYRQNYKVDLYKADVFEFVSDLRRRCAPSTPAHTAPVPKTVSPEEAPRSGPTVFICHASEDQETAQAIHDQLVRAGMNPWLDRESLRGGDRWDALIESTIDTVDYFVILNSRFLQLKAQGASYVNKELKVALRAEDRRLGTFVIPVKVDNTPLLPLLAKYHAIELSHQDGLRDLVRAIKRQGVSA